jgi:MFS family permease
MGALADRTDPRRLILAGGLIGAVGIFSLGTAHTLLEFAVASACFGVGGGMATPAAMATVTRHGHRTAAMGAMMALMTSAHGAGMMAGAMLGGWVMDRFALGGVFPAGAGILLGGTLAFALCSWVTAPRTSQLPARTLPIPLH